MKALKIPAIALIAIALLLLSAGCTQPATNTTAPVKQIRIGYQPSTHQVAHMVAMDKGWWQQDLAPYGDGVASASQFNPDSIHHDASPMISSAICRGVFLSVSIMIPAFS